MSRIYFLFILILLGTSCRKEKGAEIRIGKIDILDANALIYGSVTIDQYSGEDISDSIKLFKINGDEIQPVTFFNPDGVDLLSTYVTDGIFEIDTSFFLLNVYVKSDVSQKIESYIVFKRTGVANRLTEPIVPHFYINGAWEKAFSYPAFVFGNRQTLFIPDNVKLNKIILAPDGSATVSSIMLNNSTFDCDTAGNILSGNTLQFTDNTQTIVDGINPGNIITKQSGSGFFSVDVAPDSIFVSKLNVADNQYSVAAFDTVVVNTSEWNYLGNAPILNLHGSCIVFDKAILYINNEVARLVSFSLLSLSTVTGYYYSDNALFIKGKNILNKEVFMKINPGVAPASYTHIFAAETYIYNLIEVSPDGGFVFYGKYISNSVEQFGYRSATGLSSKIIDNELEIKVRQILKLNL